MKKSLPHFIFKLSSFILILLLSYPTIQAQNSLQLPNYGTTYSGNARGYWFVAPADFIITGLRVPTDIGLTPQSIQLMRFDTTPPIYSATTTNYDTLGYWTNVLDSTIVSTNILVNQGDIIGVLGTRGTATNSYATPTGPFVSSILGNPVTLTRLIYQGSIATVPAGAISQEVSAALARVEMYYSAANQGLNNAAVLSVDSPTVFCAGLNNVYATIGNYGNNQIDSVEIHWEVNGIAQPMVKYTQLLDTISGLGNFSSQVLLGTANFTAGSNSIKVYTSMPNNMADTFNLNDTIRIIVSTAATPTSITTTNATLTSIDINVGGLVGTVDYEYGTTGFTIGSGNSGSSTTNSFTISNLTASTNYDIYVRSNCGSADVSAWLGPINFRTSNGIPYAENFETFVVPQSGPNFSNGWTSTGSAAPNWESETSTGSNINSLATGPLFDATLPNTAGGKYMYLETSGGSLGNSNTLSSPPIFAPATAGGIILEFAYHMHGATMGELHVLADTNNVSDTLISLIGQQQAVQSDAWKDTSVLLVGYQGKSITLKFVGVRGSSFTGDMAIDEIRLFDTTAVDLAIDSILSPVSDCGLSAADSVRIAIRNNGLSPATNFPVTYVFNGGTPVVDTVRATINPGTTYNFTFNATVNVAAIQNHTLKVYLAVSGDGNTANDSLSSNIASSFSVALDSTGLLQTFDDFEANNGNLITYSDSLTSSWKWGAPTTFYIPAAASGSKAWVTGLTTNHNANEMSYLETSCYDLSGLDSTVPIGISFQAIFKTEIGKDQAWMEYSIDNGRNWSKIMPSISSVNFYNNTSANVWEGFSPAGVGVWIPVFNDILGLGGNSKVKFRFAFKSNGTVQNEGFGLDNLLIKLLIGGEAEKLNNNSALNISPNPSNGQFNLVFANFAKGIYQVEVLNLNGQLIEVKNIALTSTVENKTMNLENLQKGVYFVKVTNGSNVTTQKLVIK